MNFRVSTSTTVSLSSILGFRIYFKMFFSLWKMKIPRNLDEWFWPRYSRGFAGCFNHSAWKNSTGEWWLCHGVWFLLLPLLLLCHLLSLLHPCVHWSRGYMYLQKSATILHVIREQKLLGHLNVWSYSVCYFLYKTEHVLCDAKLLLVNTISPQFYV